MVHIIAPRGAASCTGEVASPPGWPRRWQRILRLLFLREAGVLLRVPPPCPATGDVLVRVVHWWLPAYGLGHPQWPP